jgi:hypothetical protein
MSFRYDYRDSPASPTNRVAAGIAGAALLFGAGRLATVRVFLPPMMRTVVFGATADGAAVLAAMKTLGELLSAKSKLPASWLDARRVDHDLIGGGWKRLVYREGRPPETVDRAAYTLCLRPNRRTVQPQRLRHASQETSKSGTCVGVTATNQTVTR